MSGPVYLKSVLYCWYISMNKKRLQKDYRQLVFISDNIQSIKLYHLDLAKSYVMMLPHVLY